MLFEITLDNSLALNLLVATIVPLPLKWQNVTFSLTNCQYENFEIEKRVGLRPQPPERKQKPFVLTLIYRNYVAKFVMVNQNE